MSWARLKHRGKRVSALAEASSDSGDDDDNTANTGARATSTKPTTKTAPTQEDADRLTKEGMAEGYHV